MMYLLIIVLLIIFYQDLKMRAVHWILFPLTFIFSITYNFSYTNLFNSLINVLYLTIILCALTVYLSIKNKKIVNISNGFFSLGDSLFLLVITPLFSNQQYIGFIIISSLYALLVHFTLTKINSNQNPTIPFAGYAALLLTGFIFFKSTILC